MKASRMLTEHELRQTYEREKQEPAMVRGGKPSGGYFNWLEQIVRTWHPELSAMMHREAKRTIQSAKERRGQMKLFAGG